MATVDVNVKRVFGNRRIHGSVPHPQDATTETKDDVFTIQLLRSGEDSIFDVKKKIADAVGGQLGPGDMLLQFGPNDRKLGRQYVDDPTVDETTLTMNMFWILEWLERFPHWALSVSLLPPTPPPPGVAIQKAAATAEKKDPDTAVSDARKRGEIPQLKDLPAPWGPKEYVAPPREVLMEQGYVPVEYSKDYSPLIDV